MQLSSGDGPGHDEIDMEFMGNSTGHPVVLNTNVWANGDGKKEHQFDLWFDPAADYHTYTIIWTPENILFKVDNLFIRSFKRFGGLPYPSSKPMRLHATLWDGSYWATQRGKVPETGPQPTTVAQAAERRICEEGIWGRNESHSFP